MSSNNASALRQMHDVGQSASTSSSSAAPSPGSSSISATPDTSSLATSAGDGALPAASLPSQSGLDIESESAFPSLGMGIMSSTAKGKGPIGQWGAATSRGAAKPRVESVNGTAAARQVSSAAFTETLTLPTSAVEVQQIKPAAGRASGPAPSTLGEVLGLVMKQCPGVRIEASSSRPNNTTTFLFRGPSEAAIRKAYKEIVQRAVKRSTVTLEVPLSTRPYIIGAGGRMLKSITEGTGTQIQFPPREEADAVPALEGADEPTISLTISGDQEGIEQAKAKIMAIVGERAVKATRKLTAADIPREFWPLLSGVKGARLPEIWASAGLEADAVSVSIPSRRALRNSDGTLATSSAVELDDDAHEKRQLEAEIVLTGSKEAVEQAASALLADYQDLKRLTRPMTISLPKRQHQFLIGQHADDILAATGSAVIVPFQDDPSESVLILGRKEAFGSAVDMVMTKTESAEVDLVDLATVHKSTPDPLVYAQHVTRYLIQRGKLRSVQDDHTVKIYLPRTTAILNGNTAIEVVGKRDDVTSARASVAEMIKRFPPSAFCTIDVDHLLHKHLIGKKGAKLKHFELNRGVEVLFLKLNIYQKFRDHIEHWVKVQGLH